MPTASGSPVAPGSPAVRRLATPGWLDGRLVLGVLLVLLSVILGARVLANADRSQLVWATTADLAVGAQLEQSDVAAVRVRLFDSVDRYLDATRPPPVGYVVRRGIGAGELLPDDALGLPEEQAFRLVTVPLEAGHFPPDLADEQQVDVWMTPARPAAAAPAAAGGPLTLNGAQTVLLGVGVARGPPEDTFRSGATSSPVVLRVRQNDVSTLVSAMSLGRIDLVRVPRNGEVSGTRAPPPGKG